MGTRWALVIPAVMVFLTGCEPKSGNVEVRSGTPILRERIREGKPLTVAFLGGSITENADQGGFITGVEEWLTRQAPGRPITVVNAGLSSTDSAFGAKRVRRDVLESRPDLVFVEFLVNDGSRESGPDMERIVRAVRQSGADVIFLYAMKDVDWRDVRAGKPRRAVHHEAVADHHGIPSIFLGESALKRLSDGRWKWSDFSPDACHPTESGYATYRDDIQRAMDRIFAVGGGRSEVEPLFGERSQPFVQRPRRFVRADAAPGVWQMPLPGIEWKDGPTISRVDGGVWTLAYATHAPEDASRWRDQRWFPEEGAFTGGGSRVLVETDDSSGIRFQAVPRRERGPDGVRTPMEYPIVKWTAPSAGRYAVVVEMDRFDAQRNGARGVAGWLLMKVPATDNSAIAIAKAQTDFPDGGPAVLRKTVELGEGESIAVVFISEGLKYVIAEGVRIAIQREP